MDASVERLGRLLERLESWSQVRVVSMVAAAEGELTAWAIARELRLPEGEVEAIVQLLQQADIVRSVTPEIDGERRFVLAQGASQAAPPPPLTRPGEALSVTALDPSPLAEGRDSRQVAADVSGLYRRLFDRQPNLSWLLRQRRRAMLLGEDFGALLARVRDARPQGNPQAYLEGMLKRLEREHGPRSGER